MGGGRKGPLFEAIERRPTVGTLDERLVTGERPPARRRRRQPERVEQQQIRSLAIHLGAKVYTIGTTRKKGDHPGTMQSRGLSDLLLFLPDPLEPDLGRLGERLAFVEVKAPGKEGASTDVQVEFAEHCHAAGIAHVVGSFASFVRWALAEGYLEGDAHDWRIPRRRLMGGSDGA